MKFFLTLILSVVVITNCFAQNDSVLKPAKYILQAFGSANLFNVEYSGPEEQKMYTHTFKSGFGAGVNILISQNKFKRNHYYFTPTIAILQNNLNLRVNNYTESYAGHFPPSHSFSQNNFNINYNVFSLGTGLTQMTNYKKLFLFQRLGLSFSEAFRNKTIDYTETVSTSYPTQDPAHVTPTNPDGWYWTNTSNTIEHKEEIEYSTFNLFYQLGLGISIKQFALFGNIELTGGSKSNFRPILNTQFGIFYSLK